LSKSWKTPRDSETTTHDESQELAKSPKSWKP
jgi:hypothetical protein